MNNLKRIKRIYHELFDIQPNDTIKISKYLQHRKSVPNAADLAKKTSVSIISAQKRLKQLQKLGLVKVQSPIIIDRIGMGRFANSLRKQNGNLRNLIVYDRGHIAVKNQIINPQIDDVYYNLTPHFQRLTDRAFREFRMVRTPNVYIKALIYLAEHDTCSVDTLIQVLGTNNDVEKVIKTMKMVRLIRLRRGVIRVNEYRLHITIKWFISEGQKAHGRLLASNLKAIIAQQLFDF